MQPRTAAAHHLPTVDAVLAVLTAVATLELRLPGLLSSTRCNQLSMEQNQTTEMIAPQHAAVFLHPTTEHEIPTVAIRGDCLVNRYLGKGFEVLYL